MKTSELIADLTHEMALHGDLDVIVYDNTTGDHPELSVEYNDDEDPAIIAIVVEA